MPQTIEMVFLDRCPLCFADASVFRPVTREGTRFEQEQAVLCGRCAFVFLNPRMSPSGLACYYGSDAFSHDFRGSAVPDSEAIRYRDDRAERRWTHLARHLSAGQRCLEIGCSSGNFLKILSRKGIIATGIDPSTGYADCARQQGLNVQVGLFPDDLAPSPHLYDAIAAFHVIEHVDDPARMLAEIRSRLTEHGILAIEYPDLGRALLRRHLEPSYFQKSHLRDFSAQTMTILLERVGFEVAAYYTESEAPRDKNMLLVARRSPAKERSPQRDQGEVDAFYLQLRRKLAKAERRRRWKELTVVPRSHLRRLKATVQQRLPAWGSEG